MSNTKKLLKLKSPSWVFVDWANVYNWKKSLKKEVDPKKLYKYCDWNITCIREAFGGALAVRKSFYVVLNLFQDLQSKELKA